MFNVIAMPGSPVLVGSFNQGYRPAPAPTIEQMAARKPVDTLYNLIETCERFVAAGKLERAIAVEMKIQEIFGFH